MPLIFQKQTEEGAKLGVWKIAESEDFFLEQGLDRLPLSHPHKRLQSLAVRFLMKVLEPGFPIHRIERLPSGRPFLDDASFQFSLSHSGDFAAALISSGRSVGVDIEVPARRIRSLRHRFLQTEEEAILLAIEPDDVSAFTLGWSIKEAMFKQLGQTGVDFKNHLKIEGISRQVDAGHFICNASSSRGSDIQAMKVFGLKNPDWILSWVSA